MYIEEAKDFRIINYIAKTAKNQSKFFLSIVSFEFKINRNNC
jgi:hypothetical protein